MHVKLVVLLCEKEGRLGVEHRGWGIDQGLEMFILNIEDIERALACQYNEGKSLFVKAQNWCYRQLVSVLFIPIIDLFCDFPVFNYQDTRIEAVCYKFGWSVFIYRYDSLVLH